MTGLKEEKYEVAKRLKEEVILLGEKEGVMGDFFNCW